MIRITAKQDGFRRCGIAHSKEPVEYGDERFDADELAVLQAEPLLVVETLRATSVQGKSKKPVDKKGK